MLCFLFFFNDPATTEIYTLSLHDALPIYALGEAVLSRDKARREESWGKLETAFKNNEKVTGVIRSEEHTSELQSRPHLVCRLLLEKKKKTKTKTQRIKEGEKQNHKPQ